MTLTMEKIELAFREGRVRYSSFAKVPNQATNPGVWFDLSMSSGNPVPQFYFATPGTATALARSTDGGMDQSGSMPGFRKYLWSMTLQNTFANGAPLVLELCDYLMFYAGISMDAGTTALSTPITMPRYEASEGTQMFVIEQFPYSVGSQDFTVSYLNQDGVEHTSPTVRTNGRFITGNVVHSNTASVNASGRFIPLQQGDSGVQAVTAVNFTATDTGVLAIAVVKPLASMVFSSLAAPAVWSFLAHGGELPEVRDDAYLNMLACPIGSLSAGNINGSLTTIWSPD